MESAYFSSREAAQESGAAGNNGFTLRRVNLEDAFLHLTGKKVDSVGSSEKSVHGKQAHGNHGHGHGSHTSAAHGGHGTHGKKGH